MWSLLGLFNKPMQQNHFTAAHMKNHRGPLNNLFRVPPDCSPQLYSSWTVVRDTACGLLQALHGQISWQQAFERIERRMQAGCQMNKRRKHPNSGQLLEDGLEWSLSWCE